LLPLWRPPLRRQVPQEGAAIEGCPQMSHQLALPTTGRESVVVVVGRLEKQAAQWRALGAPHVVMEWIEHGVELHLQGNPVEDGRSFPLTESQSKWLNVEIARLLEVGAIEHLSLDQGLSRKPPGAVLRAPVFLVHKKGPKKWRLVIDLRRLNSVLNNRPCKYEGIGTLARMAGRGWLMITFNLESRLDSNTPCSWDDGLSHK